MHPRLLFIASIGNQAPYRSTRHSAGHILLDALKPLLRTSLTSNAPFYATWYSPSFMNESGPKLARQLQKWLKAQDDLGRSALSSPAHTTSPANTYEYGFPATLVILHDELEAPLGKIRVKRGGPESASLRGHRGLISTFESLRGKGLYPSTAGKMQSKSSGHKRGKDAPLPRELSVLRIGIGIGRPDSREKNAVADYVLTEMEETELMAVRRTAEPVLGIIEEEFSWRDGGSSGVKG